MVKGGSPGLVVMGGGSWSKGREFESQYRMLDGHFFTYLFIVKFVMCVWKDENKWKRGQGWSIFIQVNGLNSTNQDTRMNTHYYFLALAPSTSPHLSTTFFFVVLSRSAPLLPRHRIREQTIAKVKNNFRSTSTFNPIFFSDKKKQNIFPRAGWLDERWQYKNK